MALPQFLVHFRHRDTQQLSHRRQVVYRFLGVKDVVTGRNAAHTPSLGPDLG